MHCLLAISNIQIWKGVITPGESAYRGKPAIVFLYEINTPRAPIMTCTALLPHPEQKTGEWLSVRHLRISMYLCVPLEIPTKWAQERDCNLSWPSGPGPGESNCTNAPTQALLTEGRETPWPSQPWRAREKPRKVSECYLQVMFCCLAGCALNFKPPRSYVIS